MTTDLELAKRTSAQLKRVKVAIAETHPGLAVIVDPEPIPSFVRFRVETIDSQVPIIESSGHLRLYNLETWSDGELRQVLSQPRWWTSLI